jgi:hypothetical protein
VHAIEMDSADGVVYLAESNVDGRGGRSDSQDPAAAGDERIIDALCARVQHFNTVIVAYIG